MPTLSRLFERISRMRRRMAFASHMLRRGGGEVGARVSYSAEGEDLQVRAIFTNLEIFHPTYVDIGANNPFFGNNTALFYLTGSRGVLVEANPELIPELKRRRPRDLILNVGIGPESGQLVFYKMRDSGLSSFSRDRVYALTTQYHLPPPEEIVVPVITLRELWERHPMQVDYLSLDAEGLDYPILKGCDFDRIRPAVICVETAEWDFDGRRHERKEIGDLLRAHHYSEYASTRLNSIFLDDKYLPAVGGVSPTSCILQGGSGSP